MITRKRFISRKGFTLIELLVAMGIVALLATSSVAIVGNFNRRQAINIAYDDVKNVLAQAKSYALSQVVSDNCDVKNSDKNLRDQLVGYKVTFDTAKNPDEYSVSEVCQDSAGNPIIIQAIKTYKLPSDVSFNGTPGDVTFKVLTGGALLPGAVSSYTITISTTGQSKKIIINTSGVIN